MRSISSPRGSWLLMSLQDRLDHVVDLCDPAQQKLISTNDQELTRGRGRTLPAKHRLGLGAALYALPDLEGFLFPSSKAGSRNLAVFMDKLGVRSRIYPFLKMSWTGRRSLSA